MSIKSIPVKDYISKEEQREMVCTCFCGESVTCLHLEGWENLLEENVTADLAGKLTEVAIPFYLGPKRV